MQKIRFLKVVFSVLCTFLFLSPVSANAEDEEIVKLMKRGERIVVDGDKVEYFEEDGRIVAEGNILVTYGDVKLTCDKIEVNTKTRKAFCTGSVRIEDPDGIITGERVRYDFVRKRGEAVGGKISAYPWFGEAMESSRVGDNEFVFENGYITTCDLNIPHYRLKASKVHVFPDDKIIAKNVFFYVDKIPVLWFPYYYHPIIQSRSKVQFIPGQSTDWGYFLLSAWRYYIAGESRVDVLGDYRSKKGFAEGANFYYRTKDLNMDGLGEGTFRMYAVQQNDKGTYDPTPFRDEWPDREKGEEGKKIKGVTRKMFQWKHRIEFDPQTVGMLEFNKVSDERFLEDYFYNEYSETAIIPTNYISLSTAQQNYSLSLEGKSRFHKFYTVTQKLPEVTLIIPDQQLWNIPLYYTSTDTMSVFDKQYALKASPCEIVNRFDSSHKLSMPINVFKLMTLTPYGSFRETVYSRTKKSQQITFRETAGFGLNATTRLYRIFDVNTDFLGLDINKLRHIISPNIDYSHIEQPNIYAEDLFQLDGLDALKRTNAVTLSLENKLQTKRCYDGENMVSIDLARLIISTDYNFQLQKGKLEAVKNGPYRKHGRFGDFAFDLEVKPYEWLFVDSRMVVGRKNLAVKTGWLEATMNPCDSFRMGMGYRYEKKIPNPRNAFTFDARWIANEKWRLGVYERFDVQQNIIEEQQFTLTRDLHCWELELSYNVEGSRFFKDQFTFWLVFRIKAFPDLQIGLDRTFSKRKPGSLRPGYDSL